MKLIDDKLTFLKKEVEELTEHCNEIGDEKTKQLLLEIAELLDVTHSSFLGKSLKSISQTIIGKTSKH